MILSKFSRTSLLVIFLLVLAAPVITHADDTMHFAAALTSAQSVHEPGDGRIKRAVVTADFDLSFETVSVHLVVRNGVRVVGAHFHCGLPGETGPVAFGLFGPGPLPFGGVQAQGILTNADFAGGDCVPTIGRPVTNIAALAFAMREGLIYINLHTIDNPAGEVRGQMLQVHGAVESIDPMQ